MKNILTNIIILFSIASFGQDFTFKDWQEESTKNKWLLPKIGNQKNVTFGEDVRNLEYIKELIEICDYEISTKPFLDCILTAGLVRLDYNYPRSAIHAFNIVYFYDNQNSNVFFGYGRFFLQLKEYVLARKYLKEGLELDNKNEDILALLGETYWSEINDNKNLEKLEEKELLDNAIYFFSKAYEINSKNSTTTYNLFRCYLKSKDCTKAREFLEITKKSEDYFPISEYDENELLFLCRPMSIDCSKIKTGTFKFELAPEDEDLFGQTTIKRTNQIQTISNSQFNDTYKLKISWKDNCSYKLEPIGNILDPENKKMSYYILGTSGTYTVIEINNKKVVEIFESEIYPELKTKIVSKIIE